MHSALPWPTPLSMFHLPQSTLPPVPPRPTPPVPSGGIPMDMDTIWKTLIGIKREFDLETRVTTNGNLIIPEMFYSCALNK